MALHRDLTGADLHEPKGIETAQTGTVYVSNGLATGDWKRVSVDEIDTDSIKNINRYKMTYHLPNVENASTHFIPITQDSILLQVTAIINGTLTTAPSTVEFKNQGLLTMGTLVLDYLSSTAGRTYIMTPTANSLLPDGSFITLQNDGNASGTNVDAVLLFDFVLQ